MAVKAFLSGSDRAVENSTKAVSRDDGLAMKVSISRCGFRFLAVGRAR
jgi:hypothetical protein